MNQTLKHTLELPLSGQYAHVRVKIYEDRYVAFEEVLIEVMECAQVLRESAYMQRRWYDDCRSV